MTKPSGYERQRESSSQMIVSVLRGVNSLLGELQLEAGVPCLCVEFSSNECSMQLNGFFIEQ